MIRQRRRPSSQWASSGRRRRVGAAGGAYWSGWGLPAAVAVVRPGQTIALRGGTYLPTDPVSTDTSGEPERRIIPSNYRDEHPVIDASQVPPDKWTVTHLASYWTVQRLEITNSRSHACLSCRQNVFQRLSIHDNVRSGLTLRDPGTTGNQVLDSDFFRNHDPGDAGRSGVGLAIKFGSGLTTWSAGAGPSTTPTLASTSDISATRSGWNGTGRTATE